MYRRLKLKKKFVIVKKQRFINKLIIVLIALIITIIFCFKLISLKVTPAIIKIASSKVVELCNIIINYSIEEQVNNGINFEDIFIVTNNNDGEIKSLDLNPNTTNKILLSITKSIQQNLKKIENGDVKEFNDYTNLFSNYDIEKLEKGIVYEVTSGAILGNTFLANIGPKIPIRLSLVGNITGVINPTLTNYGINNALIKINIDITIKEMVILPVTTDYIVVENSIPVVIKMIQGEIPELYFGSNSQLNNSLSIPVE